MHEECLRHDVLLRVFIERHQKDHQANTSAFYVPFVGEGISHGEPYRGILEAELNLDVTPPVWNVKNVQEPNVREGSEKNEKKAVQCFFCKTDIE